MNKTELKKQQLKEDVEKVLNWLENEAHRRCAIQKEIHQACFPDRTQGTMGRICKAVAETGRVRVTKGRGARDFSCKYYQLID